MLDFIRKYRFIISLIILIVYYSVGIFLLKTSVNKDEIIRLTPFTLIFTLVILLFNHTHWTIKTTLAMISVAILGFTVEVIGVYFGVPFGSYSYSDVLGLKIAGSPAVMGINWLVLVYAGTLFINSFTIKNWLKPILAGILLTSLDIFIEPFAIKWNFWQWEGVSPPIQNYLSWSIIAIFLCWLMQKSLTSSMSNRMALPVIIIQFIFFLTLSN